MGANPLRTATGHCLGGPLPRQRTNQTQAPPIPINVYPACQETKRDYAGLPRLSPGYPTVWGRLLTRYAPVCHYPCGPFDLHVLGLPLAFILSQDQTLHCIKILICGEPQTMSSADPTRINELFNSYLSTRGLLSVPAPKPRERSPFICLSIHSKNVRRFAFETT